MSKLRRFITMASVMAIVCLFFNCKKSSGSGPNSTTTWSFNLIIDGDTVAMTGTGYQGSVIIAGNSVGLLEAGPLLGLPSGPGLFLSAVGNCGTTPGRPCMSLTANFPLMASNTYVMSDTTTDLLNMGLAVNQMIITNTSTQTSYYTFSPNIVNPPFTTLMLTLTVNSTNVTGQINGSILKVNLNTNTTNIPTATKVNVMGKFNAYYIN